MICANVGLNWPNAFGEVENVTEKTARVGMKIYESFIINLSPSGMFKNTIHLCVDHIPICIFTLTELCIAYLHIYKLVYI
jgi:hypothetical protein